MGVVSLTMGNSPVPAGLVHGLAQMGGAGEGVAVVHVQVVLVLLLGEVAPGGLEFQPEGVFPGCQQGLDLVDVLPVHIFDLAQQGAVQVNMADGVKPMKYQLDMFPREQSGRGGKDGFKDAVLFGQILQLPLICAVEGVGDFSVVIEHAVHGAGRLTGQRSEVVIVQCPILNVHEGSSRFGICCYYGAKRRRFQVPIFRGGRRGRKKVGNRKIRKKRIAKRCKACYNALCVRPKGAAPTLGCRQAVRHQTLTLAFVGSNPAIPAKSDPLAQLAEQLPFKQWVRGSNPRRVTRKSTLRRAFSLISEDQRPFEIKDLTVCCAHALAACGLLSSARFLILFPD